MDLYSKVFDGVVGDTMVEKGKLEHGEMKIGDSYLMLADEDKETKTKSPKSLKNTSMEVFMCVTNCDE